MLENYTVTENSDNRLRLLPACVPEAIILGSDCCQKIKFPFLFRDVAGYGVIYKQGVKVILEKYDEEIEVKEFPDMNLTIVSVPLTADETLLFNNTVLNTYIQMKFIDADNKFFYSMLSEVIVKRTADIPVMDTLGIIQKKYRYSETPTYRWIYNNTKVKAVLACLDYVERDIIEFSTTSSETLIPPTCTEEGLALLTAEFTNDVFTTQEKEIPIPAIGHEYDFDNPEWEWEDTSAYRTAAVMLFRCKHDYRHAIYVAASILDFETVEIAENEYMNVYQLTATYNGIEYFGTLNVTGAFAGWYHDKEFTDPFNTIPAESDKKYAKIVDPHTFDTKVQVGYQLPTEDFIATRLISSADSTKYHEIVFELKQDAITVSYPITSLYKHLNADYSHDIPAMADPTIFSEDSVYFASTKQSLALAGQFDPYAPIDIRIKYSLDSELIDRYGEWSSFVMVAADAKRFVGWYHDIEYSDPYRSAPQEGEFKVAKFVDPKVFDIKYQVATHGSFDRDLKVRIFSSVDCDYYPNVKLYVDYLNTSSETVHKQYSISVFYEALGAEPDIGLEAVPPAGQTINDVFDNPDSMYFASKKVLLSNYQFGTPIYAVFEYTRPDRTTLYANDITFTVDQSPAFAGWYHDAEFTDPFTETPAEGEIKYAKYVAADTFNVKVQLLDPLPQDTAAKFRLYTSLDSSNYRSVSFALISGNYSSIYTTDTCYRHLAPVLGLKPICNPKEHFSEDSEFFASGRFIVPFDQCDQMMYVTTTFTTLDGTVVEGNVLEFQVKHDNIMAE